jgi:hypothetical protein
VVPVDVEDVASDEVGVVAALVGDRAGDVLREPRSSRLSIDSAYSSAYQPRTRPCT